MYNKKEFDLDLLTGSILPKRNKKLIVSALGDETTLLIPISGQNKQIIMRESINNSFTQIDLSKQLNHKGVNV